VDRGAPRAMPTPIREAANISFLPHHFFYFAPSALFCHRARSAAIHLFV
jgi:hypothetical protein